MRTIFYDFKANTNIELPSRKRLFKRLGEYDTLAEYTFCAILDFESRWDKSDSFENYVTVKAAEHKVNLKNGVTLPDYKQALIKSFLISSYAMLEDYINQYKKDIKNLLAPTFAFDNSDGLNRIERLLRPLKELDINPKFPIWLLQILKYYRLVRNSVAHSDKDIKNCTDAYREINIDLLKKDYPIFTNKAPNICGSLTIDDFYFYSACIKHFANYLTMALKGKIIWSELGPIHENFKVENFKKGTAPIPLINATMAMYNHTPTEEERRNILDYIKEQKNIH